MRNRPRLAGAGQGRRHLHLHRVCRRERVGGRGQVWGTASLGGSMMMMMMRRRSMMILLVLLIQRIPGPAGAAGNRQEMHPYALSPDAPKK
jgi:hypothetical protein